MPFRLGALRDSPLQQLRASTKLLVHRYRESEPWLEAHFNGIAWAVETRVALPEGFELMKPASARSFNHYDLENTRLLHTALKNLSLQQATDEGFWVYQTHVRFWSYMRARWPVESYESASDPVAIAKNLHDRYFFMANADRALTRNGISRLWWYGHLSYDDTLPDPYALTEILLSKLDVTASLLERSFSRNPVICKTVLRVLKAEKDAGRDYADRHRFRSAMQALNSLGGVAILDALSPDEIARELRDAFAKYDKESLKKSPKTKSTAVHEPET